MTEPAADAPPADDLTWREPAHGWQQAARLLGYNVPSCLPDQDDACGAGFRLHAITYLGVIRALADWATRHPDVQDMAALESAYRMTSDEMNPPPTEGKD